MDSIQERSEKLVLYSLLMRPEVVHEIMSRVSSEMFKDYNNKSVFEAAVSLYVDRKPIDTVSIYTSIIKNGTISKSEIRVWLSEIVSIFNVVSGLELNDSMIYLMAESVRYEHEDLGSRIISMSKADSYDPLEVLDFLQEHITNNKFKSLTKKKEHTNEQLLDELEDSMDKARNSDGINGIETGYTELDKITSGMHGTNLIIIAARPAMGKTQLALGIMKKASITNNHIGAFFSCEMAEVQLMKRLVAIEGQIKGYSIKYGKLTSHEKMSYAKARENIINSSINVLAGSWNINDIVAKCHEMKNAKGLDYVIVDYIQKVHGNDKFNRNNEVEEVTGKLKDLANELNIPVVALAQLSRAVEQRPDKRPMLSDLRDSGAIEQDADIVMFLYRPGYYMEEAEKENNPMAKDAYLMIAKHRDGELRDIQMRFEEEIPEWKNKFDPPVELVSQEEMEFSTQGMQPNDDFDNEPPF